MMKTGVNFSDSYGFLAISRTETVRQRRLRNAPYFFLPSAIFERPQAVAGRAYSICDYLPAILGNHRNNREKVERIHLSPATFSRIFLPQLSPAPLSRNSLPQLSPATLSRQLR